ncbi:MULTISPECIES: LacI family DNA-binding transcriptional regulator [unclassified Streptomyces]|uniref:LacI family DNA-binding transcriptional regulator n=1 Tax=unclassified Streptomyces TaxID=2593676 RepID=UPI002E2CC238|nr:MULTISPECIES: LacI family DNA-binding transcriptional regulator [unclassified Streptomyces]
MGGSRRVTLNDVAAASGVSRATVSFVLNDDPNQTISAATRDRVKEAARELGYVPHGIARALREGSSRIVVLNIDWGLEGNYSRSYVRGLDDELAAHDHVLLVRHGHSAPQSTQQVLDTIAPRAVLRFAEAYLSGHEPDEEDWKSGFAAHAALQIRYLADRGHTRIAMALPGDDTPLTELRQRFARATTDRLGLPPLTPFVVPRPRDAGTAAVRAFLAAHDEVTAIAAFDDDIALRTVTALQAVGVSVPSDVAVIGYDDTEYGALVTPALTTVHIDAEGHGRAAARTALGLDTTGITRTPGRVIERGSA